jgi:hypothetical protein
MNYLTKQTYRREVARSAQVGAKSVYPVQKNENRWTKEAYKYRSDNLCSNSFIYSSTSDEETHALKIEMKKKKKLLKRRQRREKQKEAELLEKKEPDLNENGARIVESKFDMFYPHLKYFNRRFSHDLPFFVQTMHHPRKLTYDELRTLRVNDKFVREAHNMFFYPPGMAFYPMLKK